MSESVVASKHKWLLIAVVAILCLSAVSQYFRIDTWRSSVPIRTEIDPRMFPSGWRMPPIDASADPIDSQEKMRGVLEVRKAMAMYPPAFLRANLERVYLVGKLRFDNISAGGTNSFDRIYLCVGSRTAGYSNEYVRLAFHHELSSILLRNHGSNRMKRDWQSINPDQFTYEGDGTQAVVSGRDSVEYDPSIAADGFYSMYAMASYEEDFNTIAAALFDGDSNLWVAVENFPRVKKKVELMIAFYQRLDPVFTESFFTRLR